MRIAVPIAVRPAAPTDARSLAFLRWRWRSEEGGESGLGASEFADAFSAWWSGHQESHHAWLAEVDRQPVGMAWLAVVHRIPGPGHWLRLSGNLQSVYVVPEQRDRGAGELLVAAAVGGAQTMGLDYVSVHPSARSFSLYRRHGFEESPGVLELRSYGSRAGPGSGG